MQTALNLTPTIFSCLPATAISSKNSHHATKLTGSASSRFSPIRAAAATTAYEIPTIDYSSSVSVFPAEACETIGGDACLANIYPEAKLEPENRRRNTPSQSQSESAEREYLDYTAYQKT
ncbi:hypothetical protein M9H77_37053 [Catharanthus roseus]|uniref:Uncharacterized protein n=1 Tax=Catharanthus roseus TaxID=4058 RepID=A0ACB9ZTW7_CATRO|nr:hypothetical protein M9H77_37053 [Catharanthus roseus]